MASLRWSPDEDTQDAIAALVQSMRDGLPDLLQMAEFIQGCEVYDLNPYGAGLMTYPRFIQVHLRGEYITDVRYRENLDLAVGDICIVVRFREGEQYEVFSVGGATGGGDSAIWPSEADDPHGFENRTDSAISFVNGTRTFAIAGASYNFWNQGNKFVGTGDNDVLPAATDWYFYYYDATGWLSRSTSPVLQNSRTPVAYVFWNNTLSEGILFEERHGISMDFASHYYLHQTIGARVVSGFTIAGYTLSPGVPADADNTYSISTGYLADEDLEIWKAALPDNGPYTVWHRTGVAGVWTWSTALVLPFEYTVAGYIEYNQWTGATWQLTQLAAHKYVNYFVFVTMSTNADHRHVIIPGQQVWDNLDEASNEAIGSLVLGEFPAIEAGTLYRITYRTSNGYGSTGQCRIELVTTLIGCCSVSVTQATGMISHAALPDRSLPNQHPASAIFVDIAGYSGILNVVGLDDVQTAMDTLDAQACDKDAAETISALWTYSAGIVVNGGAVFNEPGANVDFRVEGDTIVNLFFVDASSNRVGIGTNAPDSTLDIAVGGGFNAAISINDGDMAVNNYGTLFNPPVSATTVGRIANWSIGSLVLNGFAGTDNEPGVAVIGYTMDTTPVFPAVAILGWKPNGANNRQALAGTDKVLQVMAGTTARLTVQGNGRTGIGITVPSYRLEMPITNNVDGKGYCHTWIDASDRRLKMDDEPLPDALHTLAQLRPIRYHSIDAIEEEDGSHRLITTPASEEWSYGLIAQEVEPILPGVVARPDDPDKRFYGISYGRIVPWLIAAIQELDERTKDDAPRPTSKQQ